MITSKSITAREDFFSITVRMFYIIEERTCFNNKFFSLKLYLVYTLSISIDYTFQKT